MSKVDKYFDIAFILRGYFGKEAHCAFCREALGTLMRFGGELDGTSKEKIIDGRPAIVLLGADGHDKGMTEAEMIAAMKSVAEKCTFKNAVERVRFWINRQEIELVPAVTAKRILFVIEWPLTVGHAHSPDFAIERLSERVIKWLLRDGHMQIVEKFMFSYGYSRTVCCLGTSLPCGEAEVRAAVDSLVQEIAVAAQTNVPIEPVARIQLADLVSEWVFPQTLSDAHKLLATEGLPPITLRGRPPGHLQTHAILNEPKSSD